MGLSIGFYTGVLVELSPNFPRRRPWRYLAIRLPQYFINGLEDYRIIVVTVLKWVNALTEGRIQSEVPSSLRLGPGILNCEPSLPVIETQNIPNMIDNTAVHSHTFNSR